MYLYMFLKILKVYWEAHKIKLLSAYYNLTSKYVYLLLGHWAMLYLNITILV